MEHRVVPHTLVDERYVYGGGQLFVDIEQLLHQVRSFVLQPDQAVGDFTKSLDKIRR